MSAMSDPQRQVLGGGGSQTIEPAVGRRGLTSADSIQRWKKPEFDAASACSDGGCKEMQVRTSPVLHSPPIIFDNTVFLIWYINRFK